MLGFSHFFSSIIGGRLYPDAAGSQTMGRRCDIWQWEPNRPATSTNLAMLRACDDMWPSFFWGGYATLNCPRMKRCGVLKLTCDEF